MNLGRHTAAGPLQGQMSNQFKVAKKACDSSSSAGPDLDQKAVGCTSCYQVMKHGHTQLSNESLRLGRYKVVMSTFPVRRPRGG